MSAANAMETAVKLPFVLTLRVALHVRVLLHTLEMDYTANVSHIV